MSQDFSLLLSPGSIGSLQLRNRIFMTPMGSNLAEEDGYCGERIRAYYTERARGGAALVTMGSVAVRWPEQSVNRRQVAIAADKYIPGLAAVAASVHAHGAKIAVQIHLGGMNSMNDIAARRPVWTPSEPVSDGNKFESTMMSEFLEEELEMFSEPFRKAEGKIFYHEMSEADIDESVQHYANAARRAKAAGMDAIEIHAAHGYLIGTFLSPNSNHRQDDYGGSIENRARFLCRIIKAIKDQNGSEFPVWCRLDGTEFFINGGTSIRDTVEAAKLAVKAGADAIHVSAHANPAIGLGMTTGHATHIPGGLAPFAAEVKAQVSVPVITVGRLEPAVANDLIARGQADFVAMGRKLLADPHLPRKLAEGKVADIRPCIYCYTCITQIFWQKSVICAVNPATGAEYKRVMEQKVAVPKRLAVVGGGPAGMEAARVAAERGHTVVLYERSHRLGGTAFFGSIAYAENGRLINWLKHSLAKLPVDVRMNTAGTTAQIKAWRPDTVVVATGAIRALPPIPGAELPHVLSGDELRGMIAGDGAGLRGKVPSGTRLLMRAGRAVGLMKTPERVQWASRFWMPIGRRVVIIGGELVGLELAEFLAHRGRRVTVLEEAAKAGKGLQAVRRWRVLDELRSLKVELLLSVSDIHITSDSVKYRNEFGQERAVFADTVIVATGARGDTGVAQELERAGYKVVAVGDCTGVGYLNKAIYEGYEAGSSL